MWDWEQVVSCCEEGVVRSEDSGKRQIFRVIGGPGWLDESEEKQDDDGVFSLSAIEHDDEVEREWTSVLLCLDRTEELKETDDVASKENMNKFKKMSNRNV